MNWLTFSLMAYLAYALQLVLAPVWAVGENEPMLLLILLVFIGLQAPPIVVGWSAVLLGLLADVFLTQHTTPGIIGPWAIGFLASGYALVQLRNLLFRDSMFTIAIMTLIAGIFALLVATTLYVLRGIPLFGNESVEGFRAANHLYYGFGQLVYTALLAVPVGFVLLKMRPVWGFTHRASR